MKINMRDIFLIIILRSISIIHLLIMLYILIIPFMNDNLLLIIHILIVPFIMLHWLMNDNNCSLTLIEKSLRKQMYGTSDLTCFTCQLIEPIYDFNKKFDQFFVMSVLIYTLMVLLLMISLYKLYKKYSNGEIKSILDLFDSHYLKNYENKYNKI